MRRLKARRRNRILRLAGALAMTIALSGTQLAEAGGVAPISLPQDSAYAGDISLSVDVSDLDRRIVHVHETLGVDADTVLLYPQWLPGNHAPQGPIDRFAGLRMAAHGAPVSWTRDPLNVYAFHVHAPPGVHSLDVDFDYLSPTSAKVGPTEIDQNLLLLEWNAVVLYPAGFFARQITVQASLTLPADWKFATALPLMSRNGPQIAFARTSLETLVDSPVYAGRHTAQFDLDPGAAAPVRLNLFADRQELLSVMPAQLDAYRALVQQAYRLFGSRHYAHYDFLYSLSDAIVQKGLEHHESSENGGDPEAFTQWDQSPAGRDGLPHELVHSWNGKFRRPKDLWTPDFNTPMQDSLLWVYEGQTQYWGQVLAARSGLWTPQQALDQLALNAAYYESETGRDWRALQDTTNDPIINPRRPMSWRDWQRFEDYYAEGALIWLDADTLIRERSGGRHSLDDFARAFFGIDAGSVATVTYTLEDVVRTLTAIEPYDWTSFLRQRIETIAAAPPLDGLRRGGYRLVFTDMPSDYQKSRDSQRKRLSLLFSIGAEIDSKDGTLTLVRWNSPVFRAGLSEGTQILAVDGMAFDPETLRDAIRAAKDGNSPIELIVKSGDRFRVVALDYHDGLRYPHLERDGAQPARLDDIFAARK